MRIKGWTLLVLTAVLQISPQVHFKHCGGTYNRKKKRVVYFGLDIHGTRKAQTLGQKYNSA